jgi:hypothetical protein
VYEAGDCTGVGYIEGAIRGAQTVVDLINAGVPIDTAAFAKEGTA